MFFSCSSLEGRLDVLDLCPTPPVPFLTVQLRPRVADFSPWGVQIGQTDLKGEIVVSSVCDTLAVRICGCVRLLPPVHTRCHPMVVLRALPPARYTPYWTFCKSHPTRSSCSRQDRVDVSQHQFSCLCNGLSVTDAVSPGDKNSISSSPPPTPPLQ